MLRLRPGLRGIEHTDGLVALLARHGDNETEVLDAVATDDMHAEAQRFVEHGRFRLDYPGVVLGVTTFAADRAEAAQIAHALIRRGSVWAEIAS